MNSFDQDLSERLAEWRAQGLYRELRRVDSPQGRRLEMAGQTLLNFSSNDYLGLAGHPALKEAAIHAVEQFGAGAGASRLLCGSLAPHHELEDALAAFKGAEAALSFSSGYAAALGAITALLGKDDVVVLDKLAHACLVDAARLSGAKLRVFAHNDLADLEAILRWADQRGGRGASAGLPVEGANTTPAGRAPNAGRRTRVLIVTESVFSMDGDQAPLRQLVELKDHYGAWLMVDEAHATGLFGPNRRGLAEAQGVAGRIEIQMGTLGKALGAAGGFFCGSRALRDYLVNRARTFLFSTAPVPAAAAAATAAIRLVQSQAGETLRGQLWQNVHAVTSDAELQPRVHRFPPTPMPSSPILPLMVGAETKAVDLAARLREQGLYIPAIRYPTVARGAARLRLTLTAAHTAEDLARLLPALKGCLP